MKSDMNLDQIRKLLLGDLYDECNSNPKGVTSQQLELHVANLNKSGCIGYCNLDTIVKVCKLKTHYPECADHQYSINAFNKCGLGCSTNHCAICFESFTVAKPAIRPCKVLSHCFHRKCIVELTERDDRCPLCREKLNITHTDEEKVQEVRIYHAGKPEQVGKEYTTVNGEIHGKFKSWHPDGTLFELANYDMGELQGEYKSFHPNGQVYELVNYTNGLKDGVYEKCYKDGKFEEKANYTNGVLNGIQTYWYQNGNVWQTANYIDDKLDGEFIQFYEDGDLYEIKHYINGVLQ